MSQPVEKVFTIQELRQYIGERGYRMYVAYAGVVYDVTNCPKWRRGMHENLHWPGQDLTAELATHPILPVFLNILVSSG